jgi:hypothetical protein
LQAPASNANNTVICRRSFRSERISSHTGTS